MKYALTKARMPYVVLKPTKPNTHNNNILHGGSWDDKKKKTFKGLKNENNV